MVISLPTVYANDAAALNAGWSPSAGLSYSLWPATLMTPSLSVVALDFLAILGMMVRFLSPPVTLMSPGSASIVSYSRVRDPSLLTVNGLVVLLTVPAHVL